MRAVLLACVLAVSGCASDLHFRTAGGMRAAPVPGSTVTGGAVEIRSPSNSMAAVLLSLGLISVAIHGEAPPLRGGEPPMDPSRSVSEQDCTQPIRLEGNLRCR